MLKHNTYSVFIYKKSNKTISNIYKFNMIKRFDKRSITYAPDNTWSKDGLNHSYNIIIKTLEATYQAYEFMAKMYNFHLGMYYTA